LALFRKIVCKAAYRRTSKQARSPLSIPTRVALGYTLSFNKEMEPVFIGHMWNEVFIDGIWQPLDSTGAQDRPDPFRVRLFASSLQDREIMNKMASFALTQDMDLTLVSVYTYSGSPVK